MAHRSVAALLVAHLCCAAALLGDITHGDLRIQGVSLEVETTTVTTPIDVGALIHTRFGGKSGDEAPSVEGLLAVGELTGPGLDSPIQLTTAPGYPFHCPALPRAGIYILANVRLMKGTEFVAPATPDLAAITVADVLQSSVRVRQLTVDELRRRGIRLDDSWTAWDYSFSFFIDGKEIVVPYPVAIDPRTHEVVPLAKENPYSLPSVGSVQPPRWSPPDVVLFDLPPDEAAFEAAAGEQRDRPVNLKRVSVPAAIVIPNSLAALHEFFAVLLTVANGAPVGSTARLEDVSATVKLPSTLRAAKSIPAVSFGQPVPVVDAVNGVTFLVAQAKGEAEWDVEGLAAGTHTVEIEVRAKLRENGQPDIPLKATPRASVVVHDPRFTLTFSHPDVVRKGIDYATYAFVTNASAAIQTIRIRNAVPSCEQAPGANVCRVGGSDVDELTFGPGEMRIVEYKLRPGVTGQVFATAGSVEGDVLAAAVELHMGVSESGIPLSPATLVMPWYAQFINPSVLEANLQLLGLGYSLAVAPVNQTTAKFPRVIRSDVFFRAVDIGRAGQKIFISDGAPDAKFEAMAGLVLDLLGNTVELREWDELRRSEKSGRGAMASVLAEVNATGMAGRNSPGELVDRFAAATSWRAPFAVALVHGPPVPGNSRPYALEIRGLSGRRVAVPNEAEGGWVRDLPFSDLSRLDISSRTGEIAIVGRWSEVVEVIVTPAVSGPFALELILPAAANGAVLRAHFDLNGSANQPLRVPLTRGAAALNALMPNGGFAATAATSQVAAMPLKLVGARQDLHLDPEGHQVSLLFSRPVAVPEGVDLRSRFAGRIAFNRDGVSYGGERAIYAAALQPAADVVNLSFDQVLTTNAGYELAVSPLLDPLTKVETVFPERIGIKVDNDRPAGILYGRFLKGDNSAIGGAEVRLYTGHFRGCQSGLFDEGPAPDCNPYRELPQYAKSEADGTFLFEYVPRDIIADPGLNGGYRLLGVSAAGRYTSVDGAVRLPGRVQFVNLQLLGRGAAEGVVRYDNGERVAGADVFIGSTMFNIGRAARSDTTGHFRADDLPVGPITLSATDASGNIAYASAEIATPGQVVSKDLVIFRKPFPGTGTVFGVVRRSDSGEVAAGARVGVFSQGFAIAEVLTDAAGRFEFRKVPAGFVTVLAADWSIGRETAASDFDLHPDENRQVNLTIPVQSLSEPVAALAGEVIRENPLYPGDPARYERVAGALVRIARRAAISAEGNGQFVFASLPLSTSGAAVEAYDPSTKRIGRAALPTLSEAGPNNITIFIPANAYGNGTIRVKLLDASGAPVPGFHVIEPGLPPVAFVDQSNGVYERTNVPVGGSVDIWAVRGPAVYGDQWAHTTARVEFPGQIVAVSMRLPGQGKVRVRVRADFDLIDDVNLEYGAWDEVEQALMPKTLTASTSENGVPGYATFPSVPALAAYTVEAVNPAHGYASAAGSLAYDGDLASHTLQLAQLATIRGTVYAIDGLTPVAGAALRLDDGHRDTGASYSGPDGSFSYTDVPAGARFSIVADVTQSGVYRTGVAYGRTPDSGGVVDQVSVLLRRRGSVEGRVVYAGYRRFDPDNPANNVPDDTPADLSDNAPVPLAKLWLRELDFPNRSLGSDAEPVSADAAGRFAFGNVFAGGLRINASDPSNQELRGDWAGLLTDEGQVLGNVLVAIGAGGTGTIRTSVVDPNQSFAPVPNAEVSLLAGGMMFDLTTADANGVARFEQLPVGSYLVNAYSKSLGKSGSSGAVTVQKDVVADAKVILSFSGKVDGALTDPESTPAGQGVPGAPVTLTGAGYQTRASTSTTGSFSFDGIREGTFTLNAKDTESNRRARATRALSAADPHPIVNLELERTETLYLDVYLPDDIGGNSGILAGPVAIDVTQRGGDFHRSTQGNPIAMPKLLASAPYSISLQEIGGGERQLSASAAFPKGSASDPLKLVYPAFGDVIVTVAQGGRPVSGATVSVAGGGRSVLLVTDSSGEVTAHQMPLGAVSAQATSADGALSGSSSTTIARQSVPARMAVDLGSFAGVTGYVEAEAGGASTGTRVVASFSGRTLEMLTDAEGRYAFRGIPTSSSGTAVSLTYIGPDGVTVGARQSVTVTSADASRILALPSVHLDATPPQVVSVSPVDGAQSVSPDTPIRFVFSERIRADQVSNTYLQLVAADGSGQVVATFDAPVLNPDGTFVVTMRPPAPPAGQRFPLRSNRLYRLIVSGAIEDLTGHALPGSRGSTFTTSDYNEPRVVKVVPAETSPLPEQVTLQFTFNEPIDAAPWQSGGAAFHFYKLSGPGAGGQVLAEKAGRAYLDPATSMTLNFAPNDPIEPESFYRVVFSGVRDFQGNVLADQTFHFFSFDRTKPFVRLLSPVPDGVALVSGVEYTLATDIHNGTADGSPALDVSRVDFARVDAGVETLLTTAIRAPFIYRFVAPEAPESGLLLTIRARATDASSNVSDPAEITWTVRPNLPPKQVGVSLTPPAVYPSKGIAASVTFDDEGTLVTVGATMTGTRRNGASWSDSMSRQVTRSGLTAPWPATDFAFTVPADVDASKGATCSVTVVDVRGLAATASAPLTLLADTVKPSILSMAPAAETVYHFNDRYTVEAVVADLESGIAEVVFAVDGETWHVPAGSASAGPVPGSMKFATAPIIVPARNADTRIAVTATAVDSAGNSTVSRVDVIYAGVNDPSVPKGAWLCPIDRAALPANRAMTLPLRIRASDDLSVTSVQFRVAGAVDPISATRVAGSDDYEATVTLTTPAASTALLITAVVNDADPSHTVELPITIDMIAVDQTVENTVAITADNASLFENKSVLVRGGSGRLVTHVPIALRDLMIVEGGRVESLATTTSIEQRVNLTVPGHLYVDCASAIDVTAKGYLGGWGANADGSGTRNESAAGRTRGNSTAGGAVNAGGSHGGLGAAGIDGSANSPYDTINDPAQLGSGGGGSPVCCLPGGAGGGAISIDAGGSAESAGRVVIAGSMHADGGGGAGVHRGGSGGAIRIRARQLIVGPAARVTANGGDAPPSDASGGVGGSGGGGRIAVLASERLDIPNPLTQFEIRGGNTLTPSPLLRGGAGTLYVQSPGTSNGELTIGAAIASQPSRSTPLGYVGGGTATAVAPNSLTDSSRTFDPAAVGEDMFFPSAPSATFTVTNVSADGHTLTTDPADGDLTAFAVAGSPYRGLLRFSGIHAGANALVRFDESFEVDGSRDALAAIDADPTAIVVTQEVRPALSLMSTAPSGPNLYRHTALDVAFSGDSAAGLLLAAVEMPPVAPAATDAIAGYPVSISGRHVVVPIPDSAPLGAATLAVRLTDRTDRSASATRSFEIVRDSAAPLVTIIAPAASTVLQEQSGATFIIRATAVDAEVGVRNVLAKVGDGAAVPMVPNGAGEWTVSVPVPNVDGTALVPLTVTVSATDFENNTGSSVVGLAVQPLIDPNAPQLSWSCPSNGAMFPAGWSPKLRVLARGRTAANGVQKVEFFIGSSAAVPAVSIGNDYYESSCGPAGCPLPDVADGSLVSVRAVATSVGGNVSDEIVQITVVRTAVPPIRTDTTIDDSNAAAFEQKTVVIEAGTVTITGSRTFDRLLVLGGSITHRPTDGVTTGRLSFSANAVYVACDAAIDVSGKGFSGNAGGTGRTWPNTFAGGSGPGSGGSHGGEGGGPAPAQPYGSLFDPDTPGGGGAIPSGDCADCNAGGGVARIAAGSLTLDGRLKSNGLARQFSAAGGAGGSVRVDAARIAGNGEIHADGGALDASGGGGRIALYYTTLTIDRARITARASGASGTARGAAGTIYLKQVAAPSGELIVADTELPGHAATRLTSVGIRTVDETGADYVRDIGAAMLAPDQLRGVQLLLGNNRTARWPVLSNTPEIVRVQVAGHPLAAAVGAQFRGLQQFDSVTLRNARLQVEDFLESAAAVDADAVSTVAGSNEGPPQIEPARIRQQASPAGPVIVGAAGAVLDSDVPVTVTVLNARSGERFVTPVAADGSFIVGVQGSVGDPLAVTARDSNVFPLEAAPVAIGTLASASSPPVQIDRSGWGTDAGFRAQVLAMEGQRLAVTSDVFAGGGSDNLASFDTAPDGRLTLSRVVATGRGELADVKIHDGVAFVVGSGIATVDLKSTSSTPVAGPGICGGRMAAVAVVNSTVFVSDANCFSNGRIYAFDAVNPLALQLISQNDLATATGSNHIFTDLLPYGDRYLVGLSDSADGKDVMIFDRSDVRAIRRSGELQIPNFAGRKGWIEGAELYVVGSTSTEVVTVNLLNAAAPAILSRVALPSPARRIRVAGPNAFIADTASGLVVADGTPLQLAGAVRTGGIASDVAISGSHGFVANENGIAVVSLSVPPQIDVSRVSVSLSGTNAVIAAAAGSISGELPLTAEVKDSRTAAAMTTAVASDGSFTVSIPAVSGDSLTLKATDASGRSAGPVAIPSVPFGSGTLLVPLSISGDAFRARSIHIERDIAVVGSDPSADSDKLVVLDISNPAAPARVATIPTGGGNIRDLALAGGTAYASATVVSMVSVDNPTATAVTGPAQCGHALPSVAVADGYSFASDAGCFTDGRIYVFDTSDPKAVSLLSQNDLATNTGVRHTFTDLVIAGPGALAALSDSTDGVDLMVIDRRDPRALRKIAELSIPGLVAYRGKIEGSTLYVIGRETGIAIVDLSDLSTPHLISSSATPGPAMGIDVAGTTVMVAAMTSGVAFYSTAAGGLNFIGSQAVGGSAWDVALVGTSLYVATEQGITIVRDVAAPPDIVPSAIEVNVATSSTATVTGGMRAVVGQVPVAVVVKGEKGGTAPPAVPAPTGAFSVSLSARAGEAIRLTATDGSGRTNEKSVGRVPFFNLAGSGLATASGDQAFVARRIATDGSRVAITDGLVGGARPPVISSRMLLRQPNASEPPALMAFDPAIGPITDEEVRAGRAFVTGDRFAAVDLLAAVPVAYATAPPGGRAYAVAISGNYAFVASGDWTNDGTIFVYDISGAGAPSLVKTQRIATGAPVIYRDLVAGSGYVYAISPNANRDVTVIDVRNPATPALVSELDIPNFGSFEGSVDGAGLLFVAGGDSGIAVVDVSNPALPKLLSIIHTPGLGRAVAFAGNGEIVVADGSVGLTFIDVADPANPVIRGSQPLDGAASDVKVVNDSIYAATETRFYILTRP